MSLNSAVLIKNLKPLSGWSGAANSLKPKPDQKCSRKARRTTQGFAGQPQGFAGQPRGFAGQPHSFAGQTRGFLCGPYQSLHAQRSLNSAVLIGGLKPLSGWSGAANSLKPKPDQKCSRKARRTTQGFAGQPQGFAGQPRGFAGQPQGFAGQTRGFLCGPYQSLHAQRSLNSAVLIGGLKPLSGWSGAANSLKPKPDQKCSRKARRTTQGFAGQPQGFAEQQFEGLAGPRGSPDNFKGSPDNPAGQPRGVWCVGRIKASMHMCH